MPKSRKAKLLAMVGYAAVVTGLFAVAGAALDDLRERAAAVSVESDLLKRLEARKTPPDISASSAADEMPGSPFLEGETVELAGAALQQRVDAAVAKVGGSVLSSQVELTGPSSKDGMVSISANFDIDQPALQKLLYDLEAGMPFLFVDRLSVQTPEREASTEDMTMRVSVDVSGQWRGTK